MFTGLFITLFNSFYNTRYRIRKLIPNSGPQGTCMSDKLAGLTALWSCLPGDDRHHQKGQRLHPRACAQNSLGPDRPPPWLLPAPSPLPSPSHCLILLCSVSFTAPFTILNHLIYLFACYLQIFSPGSNSYKIHGNRGLFYPPMPSSQCLEHCQTQNKLIPIPWVSGQTYEVLGSCHSAASNTWDSSRKQWHIPWITPSFRVCLRTNKIYMQCYVFMHALSGKISNTYKWREPHKHHTKSHHTAV